MHRDEVNITTELIRTLLTQQFPAWADLPLKLMRPEGTDNAMYRLGNDKLLRLPRIIGSAENIAKEAKWLPKLATHLPIAVPEIIGKGAPTPDYPFSWLICRYIEGNNPSPKTQFAPHQAAIDLGHFVAAMQKIDTNGAPKCQRGMHPSIRDAATRKSINLLDDIYDVRMLTDLWEKIIATPTWSGPPVWIHGDLHAGNILIEGDLISAVVDFGLAGVGSPAADMMAAWTLLTPETREIFRSIVQPDDATWMQGRCWAFTMGVLAYPYYKDTNPIFANIAKRALDQAIVDI
jgi:aminoglycoside phosphotransferase (APT) family kinase protein